LAMPMADLVEPATPRFWSGMINARAERG
jgi:hypothetical protein